MAQTPTRKTPEASSGEGPAIDGEEGLARLADLTRRVIAVPKSELPPIMTKPKKRSLKPKGAKRKRG
ncbi:MAG: hypothetical protein M3373_01690 [Gemmatimonadota bacterium]|nr:hypothetical protein [Gemmatimonadota bacterium]